MNRIVIGAALALALAGIVALSVLGTQTETSTARAMSFGELTAAQVSSDGYKVVPAMLSVVYEAFAETDEAEIYDSLAEVSAGGALEQLYLERVGAMAGGGLEPDQKIHEMELISLTAKADREAVRIDAKWRVLGMVGHAEHMHVRGNAYSAGLLLEPVEGVWRLTGFELRDVDRTDAGGLQPRQDNPYFDVSGAAKE